MEQAAQGGAGVAIPGGVSETSSGALGRGLVADKRAALCQSVFSGPVGL